MVARTFVRITQIIRQFKESYRESGVRGLRSYTVKCAIFPFVNIARYGHELSTDIREGIRTRSTFNPPRLDGSEVHVYQPITAGHFRKMVEVLPVDLEHFTFVDLGCGKGAALFLALRYGFAKAIGVEIVPELLGLAEENVRSASARSSRAERIELVLADAADFQFPAEPSVVFLYNPFGKSTLQAVVNEIVAAGAARSAPLFVLYFNPTLESVLTETGQFDEVGRTPYSVVFRASPRLVTNRAS